MKIDLLDSTMMIRLTSGKLIHVKEPMSSVTIFSGGALLIQFPNGNSSVYAPSSWEKITTTSHKIDEQITQLFRSGTAE